mgnify:CR=1 FL=1
MLSFGLLLVDILGFDSAQPSEGAVDVLDFDSASHRIILAHPPILSILVQTQILAHPPIPSILVQKKSHLFRQLSPFKLIKIIFSITRFLVRSAPISKGQHRLRHQQMEQPRTTKPEKLHFHLQRSQDQGF